MTSYSDDLLKLLLAQLNETDDLIEAWIGKPRKSKASDVSEPSDLLAFVSQIELLQTMKRHIRSLDRNANTRPIERIIDAYWDAFTGGKPLLFTAPFDKIGGKPTARKSNEHLAPIAAAVEVLREFEFTATDAAKYVAAISRIKVERVKQIHKEFSEARKSEAALKLYNVLVEKVITDEYESDEAFIEGIKNLIKLYQYFAPKGH